MIKDLTEAISHAREVAEKKRKQVEGYSDKPYDFNSGVKKACLKCAEEYDQLAEWLTELQDRREADRWIPVSERLPEKDGRFLTCTSSGDIDTNVFMFGQFTRPYVIAWKHLPEPYDWRTENEANS